MRRKYVDSRGKIRLDDKTSAIKTTEAEMSGENTAGRQQSRHWRYRTTTRQALYDTIIEDTEIRGYMRRERRKSVAQERERARHKYKSRL